MGTPAISMEVLRTTNGDEEALRWADARRRFDEVAAAMFDGDYLRAIRLARVAARELQAAVGPEHPAYAELEAILQRRG
jgi:broad specificity phosphatase PhoE